MHGGWVFLCVLLVVCVLLLKKKEQKLKKNRTFFFLSLYKLLETFRALMKHPRQTVMAG